MLHLLACTAVFAAASADLAFRIFSVQPEYMSSLDTLTLLVAQGADPGVHLVLKRVKRAGGFPDDATALEAFHAQYRSSVDRVVSQGFVNTLLDRRNCLLRCALNLKIPLRWFAVTLENRCLNEYLPLGLRLNYTEYFQPRNSVAFEWPSESLANLFLSQVKLENGIFVEDLQVLHSAAGATDVNHLAGSNLSEIRLAGGKAFIDRSRGCYAITSDNIQLIPSQRVALVVTSRQVCVILTQSVDCRPVHGSELGMISHATISAYPGDQGFYIIVCLNASRTFFVYSSESLAEPIHSAEFFGENLPAIEGHDIVMLNRFCIPTRIPLQHDGGPSSPRARFEIRRESVVYRGSNAIRVSSFQFLTLLGVHEEGDSLSLFLSKRLLNRSMLLFVSVNAAGFRITRDIQIACNGKSARHAIALGDSPLLSRICDEPKSSWARRMMEGKSAVKITLLISALALVAQKRDYEAKRANSQSWSLWH